MSLIADKMRKARHTSVTIDGVTYHFRRLTDLDVADMQARRQAGTISVRDQLAFFFGWEGMTEDKLIHGGSDIPVPWDADAFIEYVSDNGALFGQLSDALVNAYTAHNKAAKEARKN